MSHGKGLLVPWTLFSYGNQDVDASLLRTTRMSADSITNSDTSLEAWACDAGVGLHALTLLRKMSIKLSTLDRKWKRKEQLQIINT